MRFFFYCSGDHRIIISFPTRRSSEVAGEDQLAQVAVGVVERGTGNLGQLDLLATFEGDDEEVTGRDLVPTGIGAVGDGDRDDVVAREILGRPNDPAVGVAGDRPPASELDGGVERSDPSGDHVEAVAGPLGIDEVVAEVLPDEKSRAVARLEGEQTNVALGEPEREPA